MDALTEGHIHVRPKESMYMAPRFAHIGVPRGIYMDDLRSLGWGAPQAAEKDTGGRTFSAGARGAIYMDS
jgi:hypothetical protein